MSVTTACICGASAYRLVESGQLPARELPPRKTPFGESQPIFLVEQAPQPFYIMPRHGPGRRRPAPSRVNSRANLYALKDLGVQAVLSWSAAGAIAHDQTVGQIVVPSDLIDMTRQRETTFFPESDLGYLRQFPVFCPTLRAGLEKVLSDSGMAHQSGATVAVTEGPRLETPAEVRMLATIGATLVTHTLVPDAFLAKELQMCFAGACYLVQYAETGSRHPPFTTGRLFGGLTEASETDRLQKVACFLPELVGRLAEHLSGTEKTCECDRTMHHHIASEGLDPDWRKWFD